MENRGPRSTIPFIAMPNASDSVSASHRSPASGSARPSVAGALWAWLLVGSIASLATCIAIATESLLLGSPEGRWVYECVRPFAVRALAFAALATGIACALLHATRGGGGRPHRWQVLGWIVAALALQALLRSLTPFDFDAIFSSDAANGFSSVARRHDAATILGDFERVRAAWPLHAQSNMPGKILLVQLLGTISSDPGTLAWLVVVISNLGGVLVYLFVRDLFGDRRVALYSLVLYLFLPAKLYFFPLLNTVTPAVVLACGCLLLGWLRTGRRLYALLLGGATYGLVFYEPLPLVMAPLPVALAARALARAEFSGRDLDTGCIAALVGFGATHAAVYAATGFDLIAGFEAVASHAIAFNSTAGRPYSVWVLENLREFLFGVGPCQVALVCGALAVSLRRRDSPHARLSEPIALLCLGLLAILLATDFLGVNRGEVIRLWIFLACFFQIPAAWLCARAESRVAMGIILSATLLQDALGTAMIGFILP